MVEMTDSLILTFYESIKGDVMNIQKIFRALEEDSQNSALGIICGELEAQEYSVTINEMSVKSEGFYNGEYSKIEKDLKPIKIGLLKNNILEQEFSVEFVDYHDIIIRK